MLVFKRTISIWSVLMLVILIMSPSKAEVKAGCPTAEDIYPCKCYNSPHTVLHCEKVEDTDLIKRVFENTANHRIREVHLEECTLQFLPFDTFRDVQVRELHVKNVVLRQLFDEQPTNVHNIDILHIENTHVFGGVTWELLKPMTNLRILNIYNNSIPQLDAAFSDHVTRNLQQISFYATQTKDIHSGIFKEFVNLDKVAIERCELTTLKRDIFPVPFNVRFLHFGYNKLRYFSNDFFTAMPHLQTVNMRFNNIAAFPQETFQSIFARVEYFMLEGNPIICDCRLKWLVFQKPNVLTGTCDDPDEIRGKHLKDLSVAELKCPNTFTI